MHTWKMAKVLIDSCSTPTDVDQVLAVLKNPVAIEELRSMLLPLSGQSTTSLVVDTGPLSSGQDSANPTASVEKPLASQASAQPQEIPIVEPLPESTRLAAVDQLESIFRSTGMTNRQAEQWMNNNFHVGLNTRKQSFHYHLTRILTAAGLSMTNRMLAAAKRELKNESMGNPDIEKYWDHLEKRGTAH